MSEIKYVSPSALAHYDEKIKKVITEIETGSDSKVTQTPTTSNEEYSLLLSPSGQTEETNTTSYFNSDVVLNPSTKTISANIDGNAKTATTATSADSATKLATSRTVRTNLSSTSTASFDGSANIEPGVTGTLPVANGGTGKTTLEDSANALINGLSTGSDAPKDNDYYISQYAGGGTTTTTFHRRPVSALWEYIKGKISSVLGLTASSYSGNSATATCLTNSYTYDARPTSADDFDTFNKMGIMFSSSAMTTNRPSSDGAIVQIGWDNPESPWNNSRQQLFLPHNEEKGEMQYRGWNGSGETGSTTGAWWAWRTLLDSNNYSKYIANNLTTTTTGYALDATQGKALNDKLGKVLWTNTNPVAFETMTITLSSSDYDVLDIYYLWNTTSKALLKASTLKGYNAILRQSGFVVESDNITIKELSVFTRDVVRNSDTSFSVNSFVSTSPNNYTNKFLIPIKIIGRKLS